jgi:hypothetical protein
MRVTAAAPRVRKIPSFNVSRLKWALGVFKWDRSL